MITKWRHDMTRLCLSTYLCVLTKYKNPQESGAKKILNALVDSLCKEPQYIKADEVSKIRNGKKNLPRNVIGAIKENTSHHYLEKVKASLLPLLNLSKLKDITKVIAIIIHNDPSINDDCEIDFVLHTKKHELNRINNEFEFIAGIFLYIIQCTDNLHSEKSAAEINEEFCEQAIIDYDLLIANSFTDKQDYRIRMDSDIPSQARRFCRDHEGSIDLLPLSQIACIISPSHNHVNKMYSDYCDCSTKLQSQIMKEINSPVIKGVDSKTLYGLLDNYSDDIEKLGLVSREKKYMFAQYIPKAGIDKEFETIEHILVPKIDPEIFPIVPSRQFPGNTKGSLSRYIFDYLSYKDTDKALPVPLDWMFYNLSFSSCDFVDLFIWLNLFIIHSCYRIDNPTVSMQNTNKRPALPEFYYVRTVEDIHFLAMLILYDTYMCE